MPSTATGDATTRALRSGFDTIVVIYAENRAFDNLYGNFPGAHGLSEVVDGGGRPLPAYAPQVDRDGSVLATLPRTWGGADSLRCQAPVVTEAQSVLATAKCAVLDRARLHGAIRCHFRPHRP